MGTSAEAEKISCIANVSRNRCHVVLKGTLSISGQLEAGSLRSMPDSNKDFELGAVGGYWGLSLWRAVLRDWCKSPYSGVYSNDISWPCVCHVVRLFEQDSFRYLIPLFLHMK